MFRSMLSCRLLSSSMFQRPMSPHLTIYSLQLTNMMSIAHRITGAGLASTLFSFGVYSAASPHVDVPELIKKIQSLPPPLIIAAKLAIASPFTYHAANGIRHLVVLLSVLAHLFAMLCTFGCCCLYFVGMGHGVCSEFVRGVSIWTHCQRRSLGFLGRPRFPLSESLQGRIVLLSALTFHSCNFPI